MTAADIALALKGKQTRAGYWAALCPHHDDENPSLMVSEVDGKILVKCKAGCTQDEVVGALKAKGLWPQTKKPDRFETVAQYVYRDGVGNERLRVTRQESDSGKKKFLQEHHSGNAWVFGRGEGPIAPFGFERWLPERGIVLVEGEKCALALEALGFNATTTPGGAQGWREEFAEFFRGRSVVILPDNDVPGRKYAQDALKSLEPVCAAVRVVELPKIGPSEDVADWISGGGTREQLIEIFSKVPREDQHGFRVFSEELDEISETQKRNQQMLIPFGIKFFDDAMGGILPMDMIVLTARSGYGKTQCAMNIARNAIALGKKVFFFALEAFEGEIEERIRYSAMASQFFADPNRKQVRISWGAWLRGEWDTVSALRPYAADVSSKLAGDLQGLKVFYRKQRHFDVTDFERKFAQVSAESDLVVIDHLNYFDEHEGADRHEVSRVSNIVKRIRDATQIAQKPVILVVHIRKADRLDQKIVPSEDDIHGSSDIFKVATKVVILNKCSDKASADPRKQYTFARIPKDRYGDNLSQYCARMTFDVAIGGFEREYSIGRLFKNDSKFQDLTGKEIPYWCTVFRDPNSQEILL